MNRNCIGLRKLPLVCLAILTISGCRNIGTGVVLWPTEDSYLNPGDIVKVKSESMLRNTYTVNLPDQGRFKEEIDKWRIKRFNRKKEAAEYVADLGEWRYVFAECLYQGLPMRSESTNMSTRIFSFREGELVKVLGRTSKPEKVGNLEGYWYKVLAKGGVEGYVFDYHLRVTKNTGSTREVLNERKSFDPILDNLLRTEWRSESYKTMLASNLIDLELLKPEYGLFFDPENNKISLRNPNISINEFWTEIVPAGRNRYIFLNSSFRITINSSDFISAQYIYEGKDYSRAFVDINQDITTIIASEVERRKVELTRMVQSGPVYYSQIYGEFTVRKDGTFTWIKKSALISRGIISYEAGNIGTIEFDHFVKPSITAKYNGAFSLKFNEREVVQFLYRFEDKGLRLLYVPKNVIKQRLIISDQYIYPAHLYFTRLPSTIPEE